MVKRLHDFVNTAGDKIQLLCEQDYSNGHIVYKKVILPEGIKVIPEFLWGNQYIFITYKHDQWYLLR